MRMYRPNYDWRFDMSMPHVREKNKKPTLYAVWIEIDTGEFDYVRRTHNGKSWGMSTPVLTFFQREHAELEAKKWNTGQVVEWRSSQ